MNDPARTGKVLRVIRIERTVSALAPAVDFYRDALGFTLSAPAVPLSPNEARLLGGPGRYADLRLGAQTLRLVECAIPGKPYPADSTSADLWFQHIAVVTTNMDAAFNRLRACHPTLITEGGPQRLPKTAGGVIAYKFRDPDRHPVELIQFPGTPGNALTTGIDHSAISVAETEASIAFYRDGLGLAVAARQINQGMEQDHLDALPEARVEVVALQPAMDATPHIELLSYRHPRGRPVSAPLIPADIAADRLVLQVDDLNAVLARLENCTAGLSIRNDSMALVRDPDRHFLILTQNTDNATT